VSGWLASPVHSEGKQHSFSVITCSCGGKEYLAISDYFNSFVVESEKLKILLGVPLGESARVDVS
jgi:hypothetical protein